MDLTFSKPLNQSTILWSKDVKSTHLKVFILNYLHLDSLISEIPSLGLFLPCLSLNFPLCLFGEDWFKHSLWRKQLIHKVVNTCERISCIFPPAIFFFFFLVTPEVCGSSQARDQTHAVTWTRAAARPDPQPTVPQWNFLLLSFRQNLSISWRGLPELYLKHPCCLIRSYSLYHFKSLYHLSLTEIVYLFIICFSYSNKQRTVSPEHTTVLA